MIFNEIYSAYYNAVARIISEIINGNKNEKDFNDIISEYAFGESFLSIIPSLKSEKWQLVGSDFTTPLKYSPTMPLTLIEKQWLKALSLEPKFKLFGIELEGLEEIEPLFTPEDYLIYDKYCDGDPYSDEGYIKRFQTILSAIKNKKSLKVEMVNRKGNLVCATVFPTRLEYSEKDDKFRLIGKGNKFISIINLARITACEICEEKLTGEITPAPKEWVTLIIKDERNALERVMLHFAHLEKRAEKLDDTHYCVQIKYDKDDETEMVIRILGFGPKVEVTAPESFKKLIIERLKQQKSCELI